MAKHEKAFGKSHGAHGGKGLVKVGHKGGKGIIATPSNVKALGSKAGK